MHRAAVAVAAAACTVAAAAMLSCLLSAVLSLGACSPIPRAFVCSGDASCASGASRGHCEATHFCSFGDARCASGRRYGQFAGDGLANACVSNSSGGSDGGMRSDGGSEGDGGVTICGTLDDACCAGNVCNSGLTCSSGICTGCVTAVAAGNYHSCALKADGTVWCWGAGDDSQLGNGGTGDAVAPVEVVDGNGMPIKAVDVVAGGYFTCARKADGTLACWGANDQGQLGSGGAATPNGVPSLVPLAMIGTAAAGINHACAAIANDDVWCWGANDSGQLGPGAPSTGSAMPVPAVDRGNQQLQAVALGGGITHTCAVTPSHTLICWGTDGYGELGDSTTQATSPPVQAASLGAHVVAVALGDRVTCALTDDGDGARVSCFGKNDRGQAGVAGGMPVASPTMMPLSSLTRVAMGGNHGCARQSGGDVSCWGAGDSGQLGDGKSTDSSSPVTARGGAGAIAAGLMHTCAARADGVDCWGDNSRGQLGNGSKSGSPIPVAVKLACP
jgi:alpha-tubulin suppressor-like RCC1 family protein